jgi:hypothetical protein
MEMDPSHLYWCCFILTLLNRRTVPCIVVVFRHCHSRRSGVDPTLYWLCFLCPVSLFAVDMERDWVIAWSVVMMKTLLQRSADCAFSFVSDLLSVQCCSSVVVIQLLFYPFVQHLKIAYIYVLFAFIDSERPPVLPSAVTDSPLCPFVSFFLLFFFLKFLLSLPHVLFLFARILSPLPNCFCYFVTFRDFWSRCCIILIFALFRVSLRICVYVTFKISHIKMTCSVFELLLHARNEHCLAAEQEIHL